MTIKCTVYTTKYRLSGSGLFQLPVTHKTLNNFAEETGLFKTMGKNVTGPYFTSFSYPDVV